MTYNDKPSRSTPDHDGRLQNSSQTREAGDTWLTRRRSLFDRPHRPKKFASVYFIGAGDRIKIGFSQRPTERLKDLQTSHHMTLELLAVMPGSYQTEARLHKQFAHLKQKGEWFVSRPELMAFIDRINGKREPVPKVVDEPPRPRTPEICRMITKLLKSRRSCSPQKRNLVNNLIVQLRNYDGERDPTARANLERFMGWSVKAIQKAA